MSHSKLSPSGSGRWAPKDGCRAAVKMSASAPGRTTAASTQGSGAHELVADFALIASENMVNGTCKPFPTKAEVIGAKSPEFGVVYDEEMYRSACVYAAEIMSSRFTHYLIEEKLAMPEIHAEMYGTPDYVCYDGAAQNLKVVDFKYGFGYVDEYENYQLLSYAIGAIQRLMVPVATVELVVVQPRCYQASGPVRRWTITIEELKAYVEEMKQSALEAVSDTPPLRAGSHCKYCEASSTCPALIEATQDIREAMSWQRPFDMTGNELAREYTSLIEYEKLIDAHLTGLKENIFSKLSKGERVGNIHMTSRAGRVKWNPDSEQAVTDKANELDIIVEKTTLMTPKQATEAGLPENFVRSLTYKESGALELEITTPKSIKKIFGK